MTKKAFLKAMIQTCPSGIHKMAKRLHFETYKKMNLFTGPDDCQHSRNGHKDPKLFSKKDSGGSHPSIWELFL